MVDADICIVGAGIMGSAAAYFLSKEKEKRIILVDQHSVGNEYCSSADVNRVFRYAYGKDEFYTGLAVESGRLWKEVEDETGTDLLVPSGLLLVQGCDESWNSFNKDSYTTIRRMGFQAEELERKDLVKRYPQFESEGAFLDVNGAAILASKALTTLAQKAATNGVKVLSNSKAIRLSSGADGRSKVELANGGEIKARKVIVTVGPWSYNFIPKGMLRITPTRQQILYFQPADISTYRPERFPVFFAESFYGIPTVGIEAVKVSHSGRDTPVTPETAKRFTDPEETDACRSILRRFIPGLASASLVSSKVCLYDMTPNKDFVIGPDPNNGNIIYGYGFSGHGFKFAPLVGRTLARLVMGQEAGFDMSRFSPTRPSG